MATKRGFDLQITGIEDVKKMFEALPLAVQKKALRPALRKGAKITLEKAKQLCPAKSGKLRKSLKVRAIKRNRKGIGVVVITGTRQELGIKPDDKSYYPFSLEYGTKNMSARPFMRPATESTRGAVENTVANELNSKVSELARGLAGKAKA